MREPGGPPDWAEYVLLPAAAPMPRARSAQAQGLRAEGCEVYRPDLVGLARSRVTLPPAAGDRVNSLRGAQRQGGAGFSLCPKCRRCHPIARWLRPSRPPHIRTDLSARAMDGVSAFLLAAIPAYCFGYPFVMSWYWMFGGVLFYWYRERHLPPPRPAAGAGGLVADQHHRALLQRGPVRRGDAARGQLLRLSRFRNHRGQRRQQRHHRTKC